MCNGEKRTKLTDRWRPLANSGETTVLYDAAALRFEYWSAGAVSYRSNALLLKYSTLSISGYHFHFRSFFSGHFRFSVFV